MTLTYQKEKFVDLIPELPEIFYKHWREAATDQDTIPLDVDWNQYQQADRAGVLHIITARDGPRLAGYVFWFLHTHLHCRKSLTAFCDGMYLRKEYRQGFASLARMRSLLRESEKMLLGLKAQKVYLGTKTHMSAAPLFESLGYRLVQLDYEKLL